MFNSDVAEISEPADDVGPQPYRFEPHRVQRNMQEEANEKQPRVRRIAFKTLTGNCFNCDLLAVFVVNAYDRQYLVRIKANPIHVFPFLLFVLFCLSFFVLAVSVLGASVAYVNLCQRHTKVFAVQKSAEIRRK